MNHNNASAAAIKKFREEQKVHDEDDESEASDPGDQSNSGSESVSNNSSTSNSTEASSRFRGRFIQSKDNLLGQREARYVFCLKLVVLVVLLVAGVLLSKTVYEFTKEGEQMDFEEDFISMAESTAREVEEKVHGLGHALQSQSVAMTSLAKATNREWPFVTIPSFEIRSQDLFQRTSTDSVYVSLLVKEEERNAWEQYSVNNQHHLDLNSSARSRIPAMIHRGRDSNGAWQDEPGPADPYYAPLWQYHPTMKGFHEEVNFNSMSNSNFRLVSEAMGTSREAIISDAISTDQSQSTMGTPQSSLYHPIFNDTDTKAALVGFLSAKLPWEAYLGLSDSQKAASSSIHAVLQSSCEQSYTYELKNLQAEFLGTGDLHIAAYDYLKVSAHFSEGSTETGYCSYSMDLYPTDSLHAIYQTNQPNIFTVGTVFTFLLIGCCFLVYDGCVERRQERNKTSAERSNAVVQSLFPAQVRERLLRENDEDKETKNSSQLITNAATSVGAKAQDGIAPNIRPIADLFPHTTIMFAYIDGFAKWSSAREPLDVFTMLEAVYQSFDTIARRRYVFKVETIGHSYVAVTGLPEPRKNHARVMARFADECMRAMRDVVAHMESTFGPDTLDLCLRIGLHSGPVTGGVLRGEKSRFQLFGDTINTAARMESTGEGNMIQVSVDTAKLIRETGKGHWLKPRETMVIAKGKGKIKTLWLQIKADSISSDPTSSDTGEADATRAKHTDESHQAEKHSLGAGEEQHAGLRKKSRVHSDISLKHSNDSSRSEGQWTVVLSGRRSGGHPDLQASTVTSEHV